MMARIDELVLGVPGLAARDARDLAERIARKIEAGLPETPRPVSLTHLDVKLSLPRGLGVEELANRISRAVLERLSPGGSA
jgi:hypothetical protein